MPAQARTPKRTCFLWLWALETFRDCVGAEDEPPGDAMQILLRLMQDAGLCAEQMQGRSQQPLPKPHPCWSESLPKVLCVMRQGTTSSLPHLITMLVGDPESTGVHPASPMVPRTCPESWQSRKLVSQKVEKFGCSEQFLRLSSQNSSFLSAHRRVCVCVCVCLYFLFVCF